MRSSIYMRGQNKSNLYFVERLVETESKDIVYMVATDMVCEMTRVVGSLTSLWPMTLS